jgi:hypothetical protein
MPTGHEKRKAIRTVEELDDGYARLELLEKERRLVTKRVRGLRVQLERARTEGALLMAMLEALEKSLG